MTGVSTHVRGLARALVAGGHDVVVFTPATPDASDDEIDQGVRVRRAAIDLPWIDEVDVVASTSSANHHLVALAAELDGWRPDVVHGHDWSTAWAAHTAARLFGVPLVTTMHGTEHSRHSAHIPPGRPSSVHAIEKAVTIEITFTVLTCTPPPSDSWPPIASGVGNALGCVPKTSIARF